MCVAHGVERTFLPLTFTPDPAAGLLGQPGSVPALVLPPGGMAARHRKDVTAERFTFYFIVNS
ncbi:hypothetical protein T265_00981 [Opisthorchis viverrini]|uniref:Uncharacterized protein n=1 Tax=Opisthorchis viverrini TaxID=6198 RepID=A0A075A043_OPIVI|nr:hypothetical protein T265_00981 [Opisthorchis viverrini]KER33083.1 hypothetical protein T265_00981 [Opisthorchis viverrini]